VIDFLPCAGAPTCSCWLECLPRETSEYKDCHAKR
jgi:hypothetical protein